MKPLPISEPPLSVALFMPAFNEAENLPSVVASACDFFDRVGIEERTVIVVDDGSTDNTAAVIQHLQREYSVVAVQHQVNLGYGRALRSGFAAALDTGHEWIAYCDSDGQFSPADLALLLVAASSHQVDIVLGYREQRADNLVRRAAGRTWHRISRLVLKFRAADVDCGFKLLHRTAIAEVAGELRSDFAAISPELLARLHRAGHRFVEVPVPHYPRASGKQSGLKPRVVMRSFVDLYTVRRELAGGRGALARVTGIESAPRNAVSPVRPSAGLAGQEVT
ncbi:glycosyltransferase family 2 protein [Mycolicibacterium mengxianglii]|uniref:glycosyltransferase family 2 protein n=1 Tax=Mycolicibacterium mengxianglii TaxID=2736649 RepID=UPI0018D01CCD|nr:glycosyltransferase family 2 protein [Mycolicibacterium mengxianglii]